MTQKQINLIVYLTENSDHAQISQFFKELPKNSLKYPDERADYRRMIFADKLEASDLEADEINNIIGLLTNANPIVVGVFKNFLILNLFRVFAESKQYDRR